MFNQTGFGATPFNRPFMAEIFFAATMSGDGSLTAVPSVTYIGSLVVSGESEVSSEFIREISYVAALAAEGALSAEMARERIAGAIIEAEGTLIGSPKKYHVDSVTVDGPFAPGDKIVIDSNKFRVTKNGTIIGNDGELFDINPGVNTITYEDSESGRNVLIRVSYRDRYLY